MNATINLYKTNLLPSKNFAIDSFSTFLSGKQVGSSITQNYVKISSSLELKLDLSESNLTIGTTNDFDYLSIKNGTERIHYFFVTKKEWRAESVIKLTLVLDVLNTFSYGSDYTLGKKTFIERQHEDRFIKDSKELTIDKNLLYLTYNNPVTITFKIPELISDDVVGAPQIEVEFTSGNHEFINYEISLSNGVITIVFTWTHMDAGIHSSEYSVNITYFENAVRKIDLLSEDISAPTYKTKEEEVIDKEYNASWYLYYKNRDNIDPNKYVQVNPVDCYLIPENPIKISSISTSSNELAISTLTDGIYLITDDIYNENGELAFEVESGSEKYNYHTLDNLTGNLNRGTQILAIEKNNSVISVYYLYVYGDSSSTTIYIDGINPTGHVTNVTQILLLSNKDSIKAYKILLSDTQFDFATLPEVSIATSETATIGNFTGISTIDKTLAENIKLIKLPYSPTTYKYENNIYYFSDTWGYDGESNFIALLDENEKFYNKFEIDFNPLSVAIPDLSNISATDSRNDYYESKLFHSDYYKIHCYYDSFSKDLDLEKLDIYASLQYGEKFSIEFITSRNIVSKFMFRFPQYITKYSVEDYDNIICVARNNEEVLYNSAYINYIRSGYNYDVKAKQREKETSIANLGLGIATTLGGVALSVATANPLPAALGVMSGIASISSGIIGVAKNSAQAEENVARKLQESKMQSVTVNNADDIDLLTAYSNNKLKIRIYEISDRMKKQIGDIFYYCGYLRNIQDTPNITSRYWFNYIQCQAYINTFGNMNNEIKELLISKFQEGVTFFHYHNGYDLSQVKENYESWLLE